MLAVAVIRNQSMQLHLSAQPLIQLPHLIHDCFMAVVLTNHSRLLGHQLACAFAPHKTAYLASDIPSILLTEAATEKP